jgi:hypothetical protein
MLGIHRPRLRLLGVLSSTLVLCVAAFADIAPPLGCYAGPPQRDARYFCLYEHGALASEVSTNRLFREAWGDTPPVGECGRYAWLAGGRLSFWWRHSWEGALTKWDRSGRPGRAVCAARVGDAGELQLSHCDLEGVWKRLPTGAYEPWGGWLCRR